MSTDHENRTGPGYAKKRPRTEEERRQLSEAMKAFNRRTGSVTKYANTLAKKTRMAKRK